MSGLQFDFDAEAHWTVDVSLYEDYEEEGKRAERFRDTYEIVDLDKFSIDNIKKKKEEWQRDFKANKIIREDASGVYVPQHILLSDIKLWAWQYKVNRKKYPDVYKHIVDLLNQYVDSLSKTNEERYTARAKIAEEINKNRRKGGISVYLKVNPHSEDLIRPDSRPFFLLFPDGEDGIYESIACFLDSEYLNNLGRCKYCKGLFIAPNKVKYKFCPGTDHKEKSIWVQITTKKVFDKLRFKS